MQEAASSSCKHDSLVFSIFVKDSSSLAPMSAGRPSVRLIRCLSPRTSACRASSAVFVSCKPSQSTAEKLVAVTSASGASGSPTCGPAPVSWVNPPPPPCFFKRLRKRLSTFAISSCSSAIFSMIRSLSSAREFAIRCRTCMIVGRSCMLSWMPLESLEIAVA